MERRSDDTLYSTGTLTILLVGHTVTVPDTLLVASLPVVGLPVVPVVPLLVVPLARAHICGSARVVRWASRWRSRAIYEGEFRNNWNLSILATCSIVL